MSPFRWRCRLYRDRRIRSLYRLSRQQPHSGNTCQGCSAFTRTLVAHFRSGRNPNPGLLPYYGGVTPLGLAATQLHEMYTEFRQAGFTDQEALYLVGQIIRGGEHGEA